IGAGRSGIGAAPRAARRAARGLLAFVAAEICGDDARVLRHLRGRALGDLAPVVEHHHAVGESEDDLEDVLDDDDGDAPLADAADDLAGRGDLAGLVAPPPSAADKDLAPHPAPL